MKFPIYRSLSYNSISRLPKQGTSVVVSSFSLVFMFLASRAHAHDLLLVLVLVSEFELKLSNMAFKSSQANTVDIKILPF